MASASDRPRHCTHQPDPKRGGYICAAHVPRTSPKTNRCAQHAEERETDRP